MSQIHEMTDVAEVVDINLEAPKMYAVIIHNDDVTTMEFVVALLGSVFDLPPAEAAELMMYVHNNGHAIAGVYVYDIAVSKKRMADKLSRENRFPLKLTLVQVTHEL